MVRLCAALTALLLPPACTLYRDEPAADPLAGETDEGCPDIYKQEIFPEYRVTVSPEHWDALTDEFLNRAEREAMGLDHNPYHPIQLEYNGTLVGDAMIRLRGQSSWWQAIQFDANPKMQFVISFNEIDRDGRFHGVRKVELDMPRTDASFLRQRASLYFLRRAGIPAQCANSARLIINGEYYGLYTHLERLDKEFLQRIFGDLDEGNLWDGGRNIETNEEDHDFVRLDELWMASTIAELEPLVDLEASVSEWAAEAMLPHGDGYYNGRPNFYIYDHPLRGFVWIPNDLDSGLDYLEAESSPLFPVAQGRSADDRRHWGIVLSTGEWRDRFIAELARSRDFYDVAIFEALVDRWSAQIGEAAAGDPMKPFTTLDHQSAVGKLRAYFGARAAAVDDWLDCAQGGGADADGDGFDHCLDCDDTDAAVNFDAPEICNGIDDDCDGVVDLGALVPEC